MEFHGYLGITGLVIQTCDVYTRKKVGVKKENNPQVGSCFVNLMLY